MPYFGPDNKAVKIEGGILVWDGITAPETNDQGKLRWSAKIVIPPNSPDIALLDQLANTCLMASKWKGVLPAGARMPVGTATEHEFNGLFPGWSVVSCNTYRQPSVYEDGTGRLLDAMEYAPLLFTGQRVDVVVTVWDYDKNGGKGIAASLDGLAPVPSAGAQRISLGGGGVDASGAFGGGTAAPPPAPAAPAMPAQATDFMPPAPPGAAAPPPPAAPAPAAPATYLVNGQQFTAEQLINSGWTPEQVAAL